MRRGNMIVLPPEFSELYFETQKPRFWVNRDHVISVYVSQFVHSETVVYNSDVVDQDNDKSNFRCIVLCRDKVSFISKKVNLERAEQLKNDVLQLLSQ